jgi:hypothetical protein
MALALELAHRITSQRFADLPPQAVHWAKVGILDTVGTTLAGCHEDTAYLAARALASEAGPSLLFGHSRRVQALDAALVNGAAAHALDFDDCNNTIGGHPSAPVLSALFALADDIGASGQDFMTAYVVGFETETKIGLGVSSPSSRWPQTHPAGKSATVAVGFNNTCGWPGCPRFPPGFRRSAAGLQRSRFVEGASADGGRLELEEFCVDRASSVSRRERRVSITRRTLTGVWCQSSAGIPRPSGRAAGSSTSLTMQSPRAS